MKIPGKILIESQKYLNPKVIFKIFHIIKINFVRNIYQRLLKSGRAMSLFAESLSEYFK